MTGSRGRTGAGNSDPAGWRSSIRRVARLAVHDLRLMAQDRMSIIWILLLPVAFMWLFSYTTGGTSSSTPPKISLGVEDRDGEWLAQALIEDLRQEHVDLEEVTTRPSSSVTPTEEDDGPARVLVIPAGFTRGALAGEQQTLRLRARSGANPSFTLAAQALIVRTSVRVVARLVELTTQGSTELSTDGEESLSSTASPSPTPGEFARLAQRPPRVELDVSTAGQGQPVPRGSAQSVPGTLTFVVLMMTLIYGAIFLTQERQQGMLRRQASLPLRPNELLLGKLAGRMLIALVQIALLLLLGRLLFGIGWGNHVGALAMVLLSYALAVAGLSLLLGSVVSTTEQASSLGWILSMILGALGGCWWPFEIMPEWLQKVAFLLPTTWAMDAFHSLISFGRGWQAVWTPSLVLLGFGFVATLLGARKLRYD